jgi:hypothetical protein
MTSFCITPVFVTQVASFFCCLLQQVGAIDEFEWEKAVKCSGSPRVRIMSCLDSTKNKVEWRFGKITRYRHLTISQIKNLTNKPFSIMIKIAKSFKSKGVNYE